MQRRRSRKDNVKRQQNVIVRVWTGTHNCSEECRLVLVGLTRVRKIWSGSSTPNCKSRHEFESFQSLTSCSDGKGPEEVTKQILQIHAILPGQKPDRQFSIPVRSTSHHQGIQQTPQQPAVQQPTLQQPAIQQPTSQQVAPEQAAPQHTSSQQSTHPIPFEPVPVVASHPIQQDVGSPSNLDGSTSLEPNRSLSKDTFKTNPSNPAVVPLGLPRTIPGPISESREQELAAELPPSKLLNSNPEPEPRRDDTLRRKDSDTQEVEEFVDAQS
jgi:hypothetical protein